MTERLNWKPWCERPTVERVHGGQFVPSLNQLCKFVSCVFNLTEYVFRIFGRVSYNDRNYVVLGPELVAGIREVTDDLVVVKTSRELAPRIWPREQRHVKPRSVGAIHEWSFRCDARKCLSAVGTLNRVPLQRGTPWRAGRICQDDIRNKHSRRKCSVQKTLIVNSSQSHENAWARKPIFKVQERTDFRTMETGT